jgi:hypothetical protein
MLVPCKFEEAGEYNQSFALQTRVSLARMNLLERELLQLLASLIQMADAALAAPLTEAVKKKKKTGPKQMPRPANTLLAPRKKSHVTCAECGVEIKRGVVCPKCRELLFASPQFAPPQRCKCVVS